MTQTPKFAFTFNKNTFAWAVDMAWDFKKNLFDCVAGFAEETKQDSIEFEKLKQIVSESATKQKTSTEKDSAHTYLARAVLHCRQNPNSPDAKAFVELWKLLYTLFPTKNHPFESESAFKSLLAVRESFESTKAVYYIMHAFAYNTNFTREADYKRALMLLINNPEATVADLMSALDVCGDKKEEQIAVAIVEKCYNKVVAMEKMPAEFRDNRPSGNKACDTRHKYKIKSICLDGLRAVRILLNIRAKYAMDMKKFFDDAIARASEQPQNTEQPKVQMPDINDLSQFPNYARVLNMVKETEKTK